MGSRQKQSTQRSGFTLIEVSLFLALSGVILLGLMSSVSSSISSKRFYDSAQETAEFIRSTYSSTINPTNYFVNTTSGLSCDNGSAANQGQSSCAFYGTLVTFGEDDSTTIKTYQVVGNANLGSSFSCDTDPSSSNFCLANTSLKLQVLPRSTSEYTPVWGATIENTKNTNLYKGQLLIVRLPSGIITTYKSDSSEFVAKEFTQGNLDLCLNSPDAPSGQRYDIRIAKSGSNTSAVQIVSLNSEDDNPCL